MEIRENKYNLYFALFVIVSAYLNTILIVIPGSSWSLFRLLVPFIILIYLPIFKTDFVKYFIYCFIVLVYSYLICYLPFNRFQKFDLIFALHYVLVPFCFIAIKIFVRMVGVDSLYKIFRNLHLLMLLLAVIQYSIGGTYPNTQNRLPMINIFFWNENEFSATLAIFLPIFFLAERNILLKYGVSFLSLFFIVYSDARLLIIGLAIFFGVFFATKFPIYKFKGLWILVFSIILVVFYINFRDLKIFGEYTIFDIFFDSIRRIVTLDDYEGVGSLITRVNAYIWGTTELIRTCFFGIGPGNSLQIMLENTPTGLEDVSAKSFHNILLQIIVEIGFIGIGLIIFLYKFVRQTIKYSNQDKLIVISYYIAGIIFTTILSGAFSNYSFIFIFIFSSYFFRSNLIFK